MPDFTVARRGTDSSGRGIYATTYMWDWFHDDVLAGLAFGDKVVVTQGAFMTLAGGGAASSAGYHDEGGCFDLRVWNLTEDEVGQLVRRLRAKGAAAWHRNMQHGGFADPHIHFVLGTDRPLSSGAAFQWGEYLAGRDGLAGRGDDYHWRPDPLVTVPPKDWFDMATKADLREVVDNALAPVLRKLDNAAKRDKAFRASVREQFDALEAEIDDADVKALIRRARDRIEKAIEADNEEETPA